VIAAHTLSLMLSNFGVVLVYQETIIPHSEIILQLFLAALLGGLIGLERERKSWVAGLRTHMLVCMGSTLIMIVSQYGFENTLHSQLIVLDPSRMAAQVVSGIGFLGAGTILFWKNQIRGLTTAASLWAVAAVGLAIGGGLYLAASATTFFIFIVLAGLKPLERFFFKTRQIKQISFSIKPGISLLVLEEILSKLNLRLYLKDLQIENDGNKETISLFFNSNSDINLLKFVNEIKNLPGAEKVEITE
jgi:putative Mg2+ transporter-C (MgtC) family protein